MFTSFFFGSESKAIMLRLQQWGPAATTNLNVCFGGNCWTLPSYWTWEGTAPTTTWLPSDNQGLPKCVCV